LDPVFVIVHGHLVVGPIVASSFNVAKFIAAEQALTIVSDSSNSLSLAKLCDCKSAIGEMELDGVTGEGTMEGVVASEENQTEFFTGDDLDTEMGLPQSDD